MAKVASFGRCFGDICATTCSRENPQLPFPAQILQISLNATSRVQVCATTCTGEFAPRLFARAGSLRIIDFVSLFSYWNWPASISGSCPSLMTISGSRPSR